MEVLIASLMAAVLAVWGNYWIQHKVSRRDRDADELKRRLYDILELGYEYWSGDSGNRSVLEPRIISSLKIVLCECGEITRYSSRLRKWEREIRGDRLTLWDEMTGGCFQQQKDWLPDPRRATRANECVARIVHALGRAC